MTDMTTAWIGKLFDLLDERRHLPKYNLELRANPFFELFLPDVLRGCGMPMKTPIIPEFPLKKENNQSRNVDFFALSENGKQAFLIELKTDMDSIDPLQDKFLKAATERKLNELVNDIKQIASYSKYYRKYVYLLHWLSELQLVGCINEVEAKSFAANPKGVRKAICNVRVTAPECLAKLVYIQPKSTQPKSTPADCIITFDQISKVVAKHGPIGEVFAEYLAKWEESPAKHAPSYATPRPSPNNCSRL